MVAGFFIDAFTENDTPYGMKQLKGRSLLYLETRRIGRWRGTWNGTGRGCLGGKEAYYDEKGRFTALFFKNELYTLVLCK